MQNGRDERALTDSYMYMLSIRTQPIFTSSSPCSLPAGYVLCMYAFHIQPVYTSGFPVPAGPWLRMYAFSTQPVFTSSSHRSRWLRTYVFNTQRHSPCTLYTILHIRSPVTAGYVVRIRMYLIHSPCTHPVLPFPLATYVHSTTYMHLLHIPLSPFPLAIRDT